jgi:hypothetical protein
MGHKSSDGLGLQILGGVMLLNELGGALKALRAKIYDAWRRL